MIFSLVLAEKPKKALIPAPTFQEYEQALLSVDCQVEFARFPEVNASGQETFKREAAEGEESKEEESKEEAPEVSFLEKITNDIDMVFFCNPNNPTAIVKERGYLLEVLQKCVQTKTRLVLDECFLDFVWEAENITMKPFLEQYPQLFIVKAFTKMFAIPGIRLGYGMSSDEQLLENMRRVTQPWNVSVIAQEAGIAATKEIGFMERTREAVAEEKRYLLEELKQLPLEIHGHAANFIFFKGEKGLDKKLKQHGILIRNCSNFRGLEEGWYRIAVRSREENQALLEALRGVV